MEHVVIATGAKWRRDGVGRFNTTPVLNGDEANVLTPDDIMDGAQVCGPVVIYDEDGAYIGNVVAEKLVKDGHDVTYVIPASEVAPYLALTMEQHRVIAHLMGLDVRIERLKSLNAIHREKIEIACVHGGESLALPLGTAVALTSKTPNDQVYHDLMAREADWAEAGIKSVSRIGDCEAPSIIAAAVHSGHRWARELDDPGPPRMPSYLPMPLE